MNKYAETELFGLGSYPQSTWFIISENIFIFEKSRPLDLLDAMGVKKGAHFRELLLLYKLLDNGYWSDHLIAASRSKSPWFVSMLPS